MINIEDILKRKEGLDDPIIKERIEPDKVTISVHTSVKSNVNVNKLPEKQRIVYETISNNPGIKVKEIARISKLPEESIRTAIKSLKSKKIIILKGSKKIGTYFAVER